MSQVTEQSVRFQTALASIKLIQASAVLDLTEDDFDFLTSNKVWIATDRSRARRCVEACSSGYDVDGTDQTSLGQFSGRVQQTYKHSVPRFFVPEHGTMFT